MDHLFILEKEGVDGDFWVEVATSPNLKKLYDIKRKTHTGRNALTGNPCRFRLKVAKQIEIITELD